MLREYDIPIFDYSHFPDMGMADKIILVDGQKLNANMTDLPGDEVGCIDHHQDNEKVELAHEVKMKNCPHILLTGFLPLMAQGSASAANMAC